MAVIVPVDDPRDARLADYFDLTDADLRRLVEGAGGRFIAEGEQVIRRLLATTIRVRSILVTPARRARLEDVLAGRDVVVYEAPQAVLNRVAGFNLHRGAVASAERAPEPDLEGVLAAARSVAVLEGLNDQENLGAIFRSAAGLGIDAVLLDPTCADPYYRRTVRVSMGAVLFVPFVRLHPWPEGLALLRDRGFRILALTPRPDAAPIQRATPGSRVAVMLGAEGPGLSRAALLLADEVVRIPLTHRIDSLNVGHAAAIAFQRLTGPTG